MAHTELAKLYYYGHTGVPDYQKAYEHNCIALEQYPEHLPAQVLQLFIQQQGLGTIEEEDYCDAVFDMSDAVFARFVSGAWEVPVPEIILLVSEIFLNADFENEPLDQYKRVHDLLLDAKHHLLQRMLTSRNPDDLQLMREIMDIDPIDASPKERSIYDLYWMLERGNVKFSYKGNEFLVIAEPSVVKDTEISFCDKAYSSPLAFLRKATVDGKNLNSIADKITGIEFCF